MSIYNYTTWLCFKLSHPKLYTWFSHNLFFTSRRSITPTFRTSLSPSSLLFPLFSLHRAINWQSAISNPRPSHKLIPARSSPLLANNNTLRSPVRRIRRSQKAQVHPTKPRPFRNLGFTQNDLARIALPILTSESPVCCLWSKSIRQSVRYILPSAWVPSPFLPPIHQRSSDYLPTPLFSFLP